MEWTAVLPSAAGWYWVQNDKSAEPTIVQITVVGYGTSTVQNGLVVQNWVIDGTEQWQGPLKPN